MIWIEMVNLCVCVCTACVLYSQRLQEGIGSPWTIVKSSYQTTDMGTGNPDPPQKAHVLLRAEHLSGPYLFFERRSPVSQASLGLTMLSGMAVNFYLSCLLPSSSVIRGVCYNAWFKDYWDHAGQTCSIRAHSHFPESLARGLVEAQWLWLAWDSVATTMAFCAMNNCD